MKKRAFSLILALALCLGLLPMTALAAEGAATVAIPFQYEDALGFSEGLAAVKIDTGEKSESGHPIYKWGFIDKTGKTVIPFQYDGATSFSEGRAAVCQGNWWGYIDKTGTPVIPFRYHDANSYSGGMAAAKYDGKWYYINTIGQEVFHVEDGYTENLTSGADNFSPEGFVRAKKWIKTGTYSSHLEYVLLDKRGEVVPFLYDYQYVSNFHDGLAVVVSKEGEEDWYSGTVYKEGYIDTNGNQVFPCQYLSAMPFSEGRAMVSTERKPNGYGPATYADGTQGSYMEEVYMLIDETGKALTPAKYTASRLCTEGYVAVRTGYTQTPLDHPVWGFIDRQGAEVVPCQYDEVKDFSGGLAAVAQNAVYIDHLVYKWGFVDTTGKEVVPLEYEDVTSFSDGLAAVKKDGKWGFISIDGYVAPNASQPAPAPAEKPSTAYSSTQAVNVDGKAVTFECYALKDAAGNMTNYIKLRDLADILNGSAAQFQVGWDGSVTITTKAAYTPNGSEGNTPFSGDRAYQEATAATKVNGKAAQLAAFVLNDDQGGGYTYYQLRDLGKALGFNVGWSGDKGIYLETDKPYDPAN